MPDLRAVITPLQQNKPLGPERATHGASGPATNAERSISVPFVPP